MPYFVYILHSSKLNRFYTGTTDDVSRRVKEHNEGAYEDAFTTKGIPWTLFLQIECETSAQAYKLEQFIKKMKSSAFIYRLKEQDSIITDLLKRMA